MSREIKFRAWDGSKMYLPEYSDKEDFHILADGAIVETHEHGYERHELTSRRGDNWIIMQFTGLKDKNGKEIYEGDLVKCFLNGQETGALETIEFKRAAFWLRHRGISIDDWVNGSEAERDFEVIGNIYENREIK